MNRGIAVLRLAALLALSSLAGPATAADENDPPRSADQMIVTTVSLDELQRCATRLISTAGRITPVPIEGGVALDMYYTTLLGITGKSRYSLEIVDKGDKRIATSKYRHPYSNKFAISVMKGVGKKCLPDTERNLLPAAGILSP